MLDFSYMLRIWCPLAALYLHLLLLGCSLTMTPWPLLALKANQRCLLLLDYCAEG
jgi:hypothetical protein